MPCTRSMRSGSKRSAPVVEEVPPPEPTRKTRSTRKKKDSKPEEEKDRVVSVKSKSPAPSIISTRSRTRSKPSATKPKQEYVDLSSPEPEPPKKQITKTSKPSRSTRSKKNPATETSESNEESLAQDSQEVPTTASKSKSTSKKRVATAKKTRSTRNTKATSEALSDDMSNFDEDEDIGRSNNGVAKILTSEQLHKMYVAPLKTALGMVACLPAYVERLMDTSGETRQEEAFQKLKEAATEMPPPPPPKKTAKRGRKPRAKRARSPVTEPAAAPLKMSVPQSFDFDADQTESPAHKKLVIDIPKCDQTSENNESSMEVINEKKEEKTSGFETPKDTCKGKEIKLNTTFTPEIFIEESTSTKNNEAEIKNGQVDIHTPQKNLVNETIIISKISERKPDEDILAPQTPEPGALASSLGKNVKTAKGKEIKLNTTFTPELFTEESASTRTFEAKNKNDQVDMHTPQKSNLANQTIVISKISERELDEDVLAPQTPEPEALTSSLGKAVKGVLVSSLVNFWNKSKTQISASNVERPSRSRSPSPEFTPDVKPASNTMNATYVLPPKVEENKTTALMNVTISVKESSSVQAIEKQKSSLEGLQPILPPPSYSQNNTSASRTFIKEPLALAAVTEEEDSSSSNDDTAKGQSNGDKNKGNANNKGTRKEKETKHGTSTSSTSSSCSSMKSASSQPSLYTGSKHKTATLSATKGSTFGSTGKLNEVYKSKPLEEAERRRQELLQQKIENQKKKNEDWKNKTEKNKQEEKKHKEKQKFVQPQPSSSGVILKKPAPILGAPTTSTGFVRPKLNFGPASSKFQTQTGTGGFAAPLPKPPYHSKVPAPPPSSEVDMDDSFKTASATNSFLDSTVDGHLSSYDITMYEDLDEDLKHRENKTVPKWASDKEALKVALFSMVYLSEPEYQHKLPPTFPKPDRNYKLFTPKMPVKQQRY